MRAGVPFQRALTQVLSVMQTLPAVSKQEHMVRHLLTHESEVPPGARRNFRLVSDRTCAPKHHRRPSELIFSVFTRLVQQRPL